MDFNNDSGILSNVAVISPSATTVTFTGTGGVIPSTGTTAQRPASPTVGTYRYNTDISDLEVWNGTAWKPLAGTNSVISFVINSWTLVSGTTYYADVVHNLNSFDLGVTLWNTATNSMVVGDVSATNANTLRITVKGNTTTIRCVVIAAGVFTGYTNSNAILRTLTYYATSLDSPNNADWAVNSLAAAVPDPANAGLTVRQFSATTEQGVGFYLTVPAGATWATIRFKSRAQVAPSVASVVRPNLYIRSIPHNAAVGSWSTAYALANIPIPTNTFTQYSYQSFLMSTTGLVSNGLYQIELTRSPTVTGGTQLSGNWLLSELTIEFT